MKKHSLPGAWPGDTSIPHINVNRRAFLFLSIGVTSKLALSAINTNHSIARKVMGLGRGLYPIAHNGSHISYEPTAETIRRADEMGRYYQAYSGRLVMLLCSGGFPEIASSGKIARPPKGVHEAAMQVDRLKSKWGVPQKLLAAEGNSGSTFDNFIKSIEAGYLIPGEFDPDNPLAISASQCHSWRVGPIAQQALALPPGGASLLRLRDGGRENDFAMHTKEHLGYVLTRIALAEVDAQPGNLDHTREASQLFNDLAQSGLASLGNLSPSLGSLTSLMTIPDIPLAAY